MPTYPYACTGCGHRFETFQRMADQKLVDCPECKAPKLERLIYGGTRPIWKGGEFGEKGLEYKERARADLAMSNPEAFDRVVEKDRRQGTIGRDPLRPPS